MSIYYKYSPEEKNIVVLSYVDDCVYWYTSDAIGNFVCGYFRKEITCELIGICTLVHVNQSLLDEEPFYFCRSG